MRYIYPTIILVCLMSAPAVAQCLGGVCHRPLARVAVGRTPIRNVASRVRFRRATRVERRVGRRMARRARRGVRGRCCG